MGIIRLLLALSVVILHCDTTGPWVLVGGGFAVRLFFIISGFYMALILNEKYTGVGSNWVFLKNRLLRLLPPYYLVLIFPFVCWVLAWVVLHRSFLFGPLGFYAKAWPHLGGGAKATMAALNLGVIGQEYLWLFGFNPANGAFVGNDNLAVSGNSPAFFFSVNPPAWSLSLELGFYLIAPFLVRRSATVIGVMVAVGGLFRLVLLHFPYFQHEFWASHFLPAEMVYFLAGSLSYKFYVRLKSRLGNEGLNRGGRLGIVVVLGLLFSYPVCQSDVWSVVCLVSLAISIPFIFHLTARNGLDRFLGELSYPVYLAHYNLLYFVPLIIKPSDHGGWRAILFDLTGVGVSLVAALVIYRWVDAPVDRYRQFLAKRFTAKTVG